ncbi:MAG: VOC family protein, partial [Pseudomonadota bacterium]
MIDHITFGVSDFARSVAFYDAAFAPLGITRLHSGSPEEDGAAFTGYGADHPFFWIVAERATRGMLHIAIRAS